MVPEANWFSPPWEDDEDTQTNRTTRPKKATHDAGLTPTTASKLIKAHTALARVDTLIAEAPSPIAQGAISRIVLSEASGYLAHIKARISPRDLAMRACGITGSYTIALESGRLGKELIWSGGEVMGEDLPDDWDVSAALALSRHLKRIPGGKCRLHETDRLAALLSELGVNTGDSAELEVWLSNLPSPFEKPGILLASWIAAYGMPGRQREDKLDLGAVFIAAAKIAESGIINHAPFMIWSAPTSWLDRLGTQGGEAFEHGFLDAATEAATAGLRETKRIMEAATKIPGLDRRVGSNVTKAAWIAIAESVFTLGSLATKLSLTTRATSTIINRLVEAGFVTEITRRDAWRAYAIV